jgi:O-antigen ligase
MNTKLSLIVFFAIAAFIAIVLAVDIGQANYEQLGIYVAIGLTLYFFINGWRNVWWLTALLIFSGAVFQQGFEFTAEHLFVLMLFLASIMSISSRRSLPQPIEFSAAGSRSTGFVLGVLIIYGAFHFALNYAFPYSGPDYSIKTSSKAYVECFASMVCFFWLLCGPYGFSMKPSWDKSLIIILVLCLGVNVVLRFSLFLMGFQAVDGLTDDHVGFGSFIVPIVNMYPGVYTLRNISPAICIILFMIATSSNWWRSSNFFWKALVVFGILLCILGAILSGGRASLILCIVFIFIGAVMRGKVILIAGLSVAGACTIVAANLFSYDINTKAPYYVARSLQFVMIEKGDSYTSISESQEVRNTSIGEAIVHWRKDNRVFFFGRSVYSISWAEADYLKKRYGADGFVEAAIRSGRTHNMITDLLLQYGLVGCLLYILAYLMVIRFMFRLRRALRDDHGIVKALLDAMVIYLPIIFIYQSLGGTFMPVLVALIVGLVRAQVVAVNRASQLIAAPVASGDIRMPLPSAS